MVSMQNMQNPADSVQVLSSTRDPSAFASAVSDRRQSGQLVREKCKTRV